MHYIKERFAWKDCGKYITVFNVKGERENHSHINRGHKKKQIKTAQMLIRLVRNKTVPKSHYLRQSALRLTRDVRYRYEILNKIEKDKQKPKFYNVGGGKR